MQQPAKKWNKYVVCLTKDCTFQKYAPFGSRFHPNVQCCPDCGADDFEVRQLRWVSTSKLFKISTWGTGYWQGYNKCIK